MKGCNCCKNRKEFGFYDLRIENFEYGSYLNMGSVQGPVYSEDKEELIYFCPKCGRNLIGIYTLEWLKEQISYGKEFNYTFFWGAGNFNGYLSNWYHSNFSYKGERFANCEQFMMAAKARVCGDEETREKIMRTTNPKEIKALGREVKNYDDDLWASERKKAVLLANYLKYTQNAGLGKELINTGNAILVEASPYDKIWGIGMASTEDAARNALTWKGENYLGFVLMTVRDILKGEQDLNEILKGWDI